MRILFAVMPLLLAGCGASGDPAAGGVSPSEAQALNDAAAMLDQTEPPPSVLNPVAPQSQPPKTQP